MKNSLVIFIMGTFLVGGGVPTLLADNDNPAGTHTILVELGSMTT